MKRLEDGEGKQKDEERMGRLGETKERCRIYEATERKNILPSLVQNARRFKEHNFFLGTCLVSFGGAKVEECVFYQTFHARRAPEAHTLTFIFKRTVKPISNVNHTYSILVRKNHEVQNLEIDLPKRLAKIQVDQSRKDPEALR